MHHPRMCSSLIAGFAAAYLLSKASTSHTWSTAGFLFCTWLVGLVQTASQSVLKDAHYAADHKEIVITILLLGGPLGAIQTAWILHLPVQRLHSVQTTVGRQLIPVSKLSRRVYQFGAVSHINQQDFTVWICQGQEKAQNQGKRDQDVVVGIQGTYFVHCEPLSTTWDNGVNSSPLKRVLSNPSGGAALRSMLYVASC